MDFSFLLAPVNSINGAYVWLWGVATVMGFLLVASAARSWRRPLVPDGHYPGLSRTVWLAMALVLGISAVSYFYGLRSHGSWLHRWDLYHTVITAKYHEELGYFGLYECTLALDAGHEQRLSEVRRLRDLRTHRVRSRESLMQNNDCAQGFTPARREAFLKDLAALDALHPRWRGMLRDKGYNGTPVYTSLQKLLWDHLPLNGTVMTLLAGIDIVLILLALFIIGRAFGWPLMLVAGLFFFSNFPNRYTHMGGSVLRFDYVAMLMFALAALKSGRHALAGGCMAYAVMARLFPLTFVGAYGLYMAYQAWRSRQISRQALRFAAAFSGVATALFGLSLLLAGGLESWQAWWQNMLIHSGKTAGYRIGFPHLFMMQGHLSGPEGFVSFPEKARYFADYRGWWAACVLLWLGGVSWFARRRDVVSFTAGIGLLAFFLGMVATRYYYAVLVLLLLVGTHPLRDRGFRLMAGGLFLISALGFTALHFNDFRPWVYNTVLSLALTVYLVIYSLWLAWPQAPQTVEQSPSPDCT